MVSFILMRKSIVILGAVFSFVSASPVVAADAYTFGKDHTVIGSVQDYRVKEGESLIEIARDFDLGYNEVQDANPTLDPFLPGTGAEVVIPQQWVLPDVDFPGGIVVNISEMRLYYFFEQGKSKMVRTFPIGIGDEGTDTPAGTFRIVQKTVNPSWHVPASIKKERPELPPVVPPGPENPLGSHALRLSIGDVLIHGTNKPFGVGRRVSHGCIRLYPEDIPKLYEAVPNGTKVTIVRQPVKVGVRGKRIYMEVHQDEYLKQFNYLNESVRILVRKGLLNAADMDKVYKVVGKKEGIPVDISLQKEEGIQKSGDFRIP